MSNNCEIIKWTILLILGAVLVLTGPNDAKSETLDDIIAGAKKEGKVRVGITVRKKRGKMIKAPRLIAAFQKRYPFIEVEHTRIGGSREREKILSELVGGLVNYDVATLALTQAVTGRKAGIFRKVDWKKLGIKPDLIHPQGLGVRYRVQVVGIAYNKKLVPEEVGQKLTWEEFTEPKWKGKFAIDDRPRHLEILYQENAWGKEKTLDYARRLKANDPIVERSRSGAIFKLMVGAFPVIHGAGWSHVKRQAFSGGADHLDITFPEPVIISAGDLVFVPRGAKNPNAALLWIRWSVSEEGQRILDSVQSTGAPISPQSSAYKQIQGKKVIRASWEYQLRAEDILKEILITMGYPVVR